MKKMQLEQHPNPKAAHDDRANSNLWFVKRVTNSTTPRVGDMLTRAEVDNYCEREDWTVEISG